MNSKNSGDGTRRKNRSYRKPPPSGDPFLDKGLPSNVEAERSILGAILLDNSVIDQAISMLKPHELFLDSNRRIYESMLRLREFQMPIDSITLGDDLRRVNLFEQVGGVTYIASLIDGVPRTDTIEPYAKLVKDKAAKRAGIALCSETIHKLFDEEDEVSQVFAEHAETMNAIVIGHTAARARVVGEITKEYLVRIEEIGRNGGLLLGLPTGFADWDRVTSGHRRDRLIVIAARPSMGKTALLGNLLEAAGLAGALCLFFSLEMSEAEIIGRLLAGIARVDIYRLEHGYLNRDEWARLLDAAAVLQTLAIYIDDTPGLSIAEIGARARRFRAEHAAELEANENNFLLAADYLQLIKGTREYYNRVQEVGEVARGLKNLAKELDAPVIASAQLSRAPDTRGKDHKPQLSDLRESGEIEQAADIVAFLYREEFYAPSDENRGLAELLFRKHRGGICPIDLKLVFLREFTRFEPMWTEDRYGGSSSSYRTETAPAAVEPEPSTTGTRAYTPILDFVEENDND